MHWQDGIRVLSGLVGICAIGGALLMLDDADAGVSPPDRPPVQVLAAVEERPAATTSTTGATTVPVPPSTVPLVSLPPTTTSTSTTTTSTTVPASPTTIVGASELAVGREAVETIGYPWQERFPTWRMEVAHGRDGVRALTFPDRRVVELYVRPSDTVDEMRRVFAHELGHVADLELNDDEDRRRWRELRGVGEAIPWWPDGTSFDFDTLAGDFAEGFAAWLVGAETQSHVGGPIRDVDLALMEELVG